MSLDSVTDKQVPALFTENFDYEDLRKDLVTGVLTSDILSKTIYCYIAKEGYCASITDYDKYWAAWYISAMPRINI